MKFKVIDPKGLHFGGKHLQTGETLTSEPPHGTHVNTALHFRQIQPVPEDKEDPAPAAESPEAPKPEGKGGKGGKKDKEDPAPAAE